MKSRRNFGLLVVLLLFLLTIPLTVWSVKNLRFETRKRAEELTPKEISETQLLNITKPIYRFSVDGQITLNKENSFLRIILVDKNQNEYLVYEAYPLIVNQNSFSFTDTCEETCVLEEVMPESLRIEGYATSYQITKTSFLDNPQKLPQRVKPMGFAPEKERIKEEKENLKIQKLNEQIKKKGLKWIAGETSISKLSYAEKKKLFTKPDGTPVDKLPNLQGFEYYKGGVFEIQSEDEPTTPTPTTEPSLLPASWDWRNVHGENWNTPVRDQGATNTCFIFSAVGALESAINLYYNQHLNVDLSEQTYADCVNSFDPFLGMNPFNFSQCKDPNQCYPDDYCSFGVHGLPDEGCDSYVSRDIYPPHCDLDHICSDWQSRIWKPSDFHNYMFFSHRGTPNCPKQTIDLSENDFKKILINKGPMSSGIGQMGHAMVLVGYQGRADWKTIQTCPWNEFCDPAITECIPIECNNPGEEKTICFNNNKYGNSLLITYKCELSPYTNSQKYEWVKEEMNPRSCPTNTKCVNNECRPQEEYNLFEGKRECSLLGRRDFPREISIYQPQGGDNYWIFKNSWGENWGENGYANIDASLPELGWGSLPLGPFIPPPNRNYWPVEFENTIKCVDKDNDTYCNWGISENKPDTCPAFCRPEKDCDDSNPNLGPFDSNLNCIPLNVTPTPSSCPNGEKGNLNCDVNGLINETDLAILLARWGEPDLPTLETFLSNWKTR